MILISLRRFSKPSSQPKKEAPKRVRVSKKMEEEAERKSEANQTHNAKSDHKSKSDHKPKPSHNKDTQKRQNKPKPDSKAKSNDKADKRNPNQTKEYQEKQRREDTKGRDKNQNQKSSKSSQSHTHSNSQKNGNKDSRNKYKKSDYEFDAIIESEGVLDMMPDGYGFLRSSDYNYLSSPDDIYLSQSQIKLFGLKTGDTVLGQVRPPKEGEKYFPLIKIIQINGLDPKVVRDRVSFEHLTPLFPQEKFNIADRRPSMSTRIMDMFAPIGKGQRGMIVS